jgi:pyruvate-ferredoxin/flavodoxin oxidoreductase
VENIQNSEKKQENKNITKGNKNYQVMDGNMAAAHVAFAFSEVAAIYPITPASPMGESADEWASKGKKNMFGNKVDVVEMQSEAGAAGTVHGILSAGSLSTTFTASQGLLLKIPNMYKIAGEMLPTVFHIAARTLAGHSLSIFGDHSDVMAARSTGFAMLASGSVQEVQDLSIVAHLSTLEGKVPFMQFFDGFRTSHELQKIDVIDYDTMKEFVDIKYIDEFRKMALTPDNPRVKVGAQNPDVFFQGKERANKYYMNLPTIVKKYMKQLGDKTGRVYNLFDYVGAKDAEKIIILMGSGTETVEETIKYLNSKGEKVGAIKVRLFRPFSLEDFKAAIPNTVKKIAVLDRMRDPGAIGEPLFMDIATALQSSDIKIIGGRYGISSKEFTPSMVNAIFKHLDGKCTHNFTVGINDDLTNTSLTVEENIEVEPEGVTRCKFWGFGSDGTVSANKNSIKIIGEKTDLFVQAYFSYDSKKSGGTTISHLRFGKEKIAAPYLLTTSDFIALHKPEFIGNFDILEGIRDQGIFLLNTSAEPEKVFETLTKDMQDTILNKKIKFYAIDATKIANEVGLGNRISTIMQAAFFKLANIIPNEQAIGYIKDAIKKTFQKKGQEIVDMNYLAVDKAVNELYEVTMPKSYSSVEERVYELKDGFEKDVILPILKLKGDSIPVSLMPLDGSVPLGTSRVEKRGIAESVSSWIPEKCIQCGRCSLVCPHAVIRTKQISYDDLKNAPESFKTIKAMVKDKELAFKVQVYIEDCTGCGVCVDACPVKDKALKMSPIQEERAKNENENYKFFDSLPDNSDGAVPKTVKWSQFKKPLFEFSGACGGCGETAYVKLMTQLFGDRMIIANATGCSSIYGGTFPTVPYCKNNEGKGPAWANSLFEDNAEYGFGMRLAVDSIRGQVLDELNKVKTDANDELKQAIKDCIPVWGKTDDESISKQKKLMALLPDDFKNKDYVVNKSVWCLGGDGWAYDIGFGGLDHVLAQKRNVNILVVDTETYSNTGGQASKSTPMGAIAKFAASGKETAKKNLGLMMMGYENAYVASVNMGADQNQVIKAMLEAEQFDGPSIIIAYAPCIAHGINMSKTHQIQKDAASSGYWPLYRFNPKNEKPLTFDSKDHKISFMDFISNEKRYTMLKGMNPERADKLFKEGEEFSNKRFEKLKNLANNQ